MSRRAARLTAVEVLYGADVRGASALELLSEREDVDPYASHLVEEIHRRSAELDALIGDHSRDWRPERMSPVDRNVLRLATLELLEGDVPPAAVIDEAVEIAKHFSGSDAGRFVNGVLEAVRQTVGGGGSEDGGGVGRSGDGGGGATGASGDGGTASASTTA